MVIDASSHCSNHHFSNLTATRAARNNLSIIIVLPTICAACYNPLTERARLVLITKHPNTLCQIETHWPSCLAGFMLLTDLKSPSCCFSLHPGGFVSLRSAQCHLVLHASGVKDLKVCVSGYHDWRYVFLSMPDSHSSNHHFPIALLLVLLRTIYQPNLQVCRPV